MLHSLRSVFLLLVLGPALLHVPAAHAAAANLILVTLDGLRWQEVFRGLDAQLAQSEEYNRLGPQLHELFGATATQGSAQRLLPFLHGVVFRDGAVLGNRDASSCARVTNPWYFSYPGYNEILSGVADPAIDSNAAIPNPNVTVLEWLHRRPDFAGRVAVFASWNVFPAILNVERSGLPVNVGAVTTPATPFETTLARLQDDLPTLWSTVRLDAFTHHYALEYLRRERPRVLYVAYGETDDFAHDGHYEQVLLAANRSDRFLRELWDFVQTEPGYRDNTVLFVTVDHGRGEEPLETWQHHASKEALAGYMQSLARFEDGIVGSEAVWMAALGPGIGARGNVPTEGCVGANQVAATLLRLLGIEPQAFDAHAGPALELLLEVP